MYYDPDPGPWRFVVGMLAGLLVAGIAWGIWTMLQPDDPPSSGPTGPGGLRSTPTGPLAPSTAPAATPCEAVYAAQAAPLAAGAPALEQWEVHIGAMNQLVTGAITLEQATAFWDDTRVRARALLDRFRAADDEYAGRTIRCPSPRTLPDDAAGSPRCAEAVTRRHRAVRTLVVALATWDEHVRHMEMLRHGHLSPARAQELWLASWQAGVAEVREHRTALRAARGARC